MLHHYVHKERPLISTLVLAIGVVFSLSSMLYASSQVTTISLTILAPTTNTGSTNTGSTNNGDGIGRGEEKEGCDGDNDEDDIGCDEESNDTIDDTIEENTDTSNIDGNINIQPETIEQEQTHGAAEEQSKDNPVSIKKPSIPEAIGDKEAITPPVNKNEEHTNYGCVLPTTPSTSTSTPSTSTKTDSFIVETTNIIQTIKRESIKIFEERMSLIFQVPVEKIRIVTRKSIPIIKKYNYIVFKTAVSIPTQRFIELVTFPITNDKPSFCIFDILPTQITSALDITRFK